MWVDDALELAQAAEKERTAMSILRIHALIYEHAPGLCWQPDYMSIHTKFFRHVAIAAADCEKMLWCMYRGCGWQDRLFSDIFHDLCLAHTWYHHTPIL